VAITLLAVDDSVTMRKVLEITFAGPEFRVVTANSPDVALQKLKTDRPDLVISDITLEPKTGYELCKAIKQLSPGTPVLLLSSKQNPFDPQRGTSSQADDHMDKPFDTQQMIDKVKKMLQARGDVGAKPAAAASVAQPALRPATSPNIPVQTPPAATPTRAKTLIYNPPAATPQAAAAPTVATAKAQTAVTPVAGKVEQRPTGPAPTPPTGLPRQRTVATGVSPQPTQAAAQHAPAAAAGAVAAQVNGQMAAKLEGLGLTPAQVDAVVALSREVVERVVWEVVPVLAETLIREELARLTSK
jgi:DNA-binding response OmpR family regulator